MWVNAKGLLIYNPDRDGLKKEERNTPWWLVLNVSNDLTALYRHFIHRHRGISLQKPAFTSHVTVCDGRLAVPKEKQYLWKKYHKTWIDFQYNVEIEQHWKFFVLPVQCEKLLDIREELGFTRNPKGSLHLTIGRLPD